MSNKPTASLQPHAQTFEAIFPGTSQVVAIGASSAQSTALQTTTTVVQLVATVACFVAIGSNPTAVANTTCYVPANIPVKYGVVGGNKIAVIQASGAGSLFITEGV